MNEELWTIGRSLRHAARLNPHETVLICALEDGSQDTLSRAQLEDWSNQLAHKLRAEGVGQGAFVAIVLPTCLEHLVAAIAIHKVGGCPMPVNVRMPAAERDALLELGQAAAIISDAAELGGIGRKEMAELRDADSPWSASLLPDVIPEPAKAVASGGSTGKPKLIVSPGAFAYPYNSHPLADLFHLEDNDLMYSPGPLYHNAPFLFSLITLFQGGRVMINERFNAGHSLDLIEAFRPTVLNLVPTMMQRMLRVPGIEQRDFGSVRSLWHLAAPCPAWAKEAWFDLLGAERVWEMWAATEITGVTSLDGQQWLEHRGSVGQGYQTEIRILDEHGEPCPNGEVGEIWTRFAGAPPQYSYLGSDPMPEIDGGFTWVGDLGYLDDEGYLYLSDRRVDLIISGGANIYPAEVEAALTAHPGVRDTAVIGLSDEDLGQSVHAIIEAMDEQNPPPVEELDALCRKHLSRYKAPRSYEFLPGLPRNQAGKIRRSSLRDEREAAPGS